MPIVWNGQGAAPGLATGRAHVIRTDRDFGEFGGGVLVVRHATPDVFSCLARAEGAVSEAGGLLSHLAVLAREIGKPCVTGVRGIIAALDPGVWLHVNGTEGSVEALGGTPPDGAPVPPPPPSFDMVPVLQFGRFSGAFERTEEVFDVQVALQAAALVSMPSSLGIGEDWRFTVHDGKVWLDRVMLRQTCNALVQALESSTIRSQTLRELYVSLCDWTGWMPPRTDGANQQQLGAAVARYVWLNQLTWAAAVAKEPLTDRYKSFLFSRLTDLNEIERREVFLRSLVMPRTSYILQVHMDHSGGLHGSSGHLWGETGRTSDALSRGTAFAVAQDALRRRQAAMHALAGLLSGPDFDIVSFYVSAITDLVELTERKNTELFRCGQLLFQGEARKRATSRLLGPSMGSFRSASDAGSIALLQAVLIHLRSFAALSDITDLSGRISDTSLWNNN